MQLTFEQSADGVDSGLAKAIVVGAGAIAHDATGEVVGGGVPVYYQEPSQGAPHPAQADSLTIEEQLLFVGEPLRS